MTVTGEDVSVMMDREEKNVEHPAQDETIIALKIIATYAQFGLIPIVIPPLIIDPPIPIERIPVQRATDLNYLKEMAERYGYVFYVESGPAPFTNTAYWGPPVRLGVPQKALSVNLGPETNVNSVNFQSDSNAPTLVAGQVQDRQTGQTMPVQTFASTRLPPLAAMPAILVNQPNVRTTRFDGTGLNTMQAFARAQGQTDASTDHVLTVTGELDAVRYGDILKARGLVGLRGAGYNHDGFYYVKNVTHTIQRGDYKQRFTLTREGFGSTTPIVRP
jgi:phage protein D